MVAHERVKRVLLLHRRNRRLGLRRRKDRKGGARIRSLCPSSFCHSLSSHASEHARPLALSHNATASALAYMSLDISSTRRQT
eukprot:6194005-Pleurochrysis_carterae.AAC.1